MAKPGYYMVNGDFVKNPDGSYVDICDYKNCREAAKTGWIKCEKHINVGYPELEKPRQMKQLLKMLGIH